MNDNEKNDVDKNDKNDTEDKEEIDLAWLVACSPNMREICGADDDGSSPAQCAAKYFPKLSVCAENEQDWQLVAKVLDEWSVTEDPFWFYDLFVFRSADRYSLICELERRAKETGQESVKGYWTGLVELVIFACARGRFWNCLSAYGHSRNPRFLEYWAECFARLQPRYSNSTINWAIFDRWVVQPRDVVALRAVLQERVRLQKLYSSSDELFQRLFAVDWVEGWETTKQTMEDSVGFDSLLISDYHLPPSVSCVAAFWWMTAEFVRLGGCARETTRAWLRHSITRMAAAGQLVEWNPADVPPEMNVVQALRICCEEIGGRPEVIVPKLLEAVDASSDPDGARRRVLNWAKMVRTWRRHTILNLLAANGLSCQDEDDVEDTSPLLACGIRRRV